MAIASMHLGVSRQSAELQTECQNGKERLFSKTGFANPHLTYLTYIIRFAII